MKSDNERVAQSGMGAHSKNAEYSIERIFTDLVFYLDTLGNASKNFLKGNSEKFDEEDDEEYVSLQCIASLADGWCPSDSLKSVKSSLLAAAA